MAVPAGVRESGVASDRDIAAFDARAVGYERGWLGRMHHDIADRTADLALSLVPAPRRVLDVGCGTGYLLRQLARRCPEAVVLAGVDPAPAMIGAARAAAADGRLALAAGAAESLPWPTAAFDLVVSTTSFDHWADQGAGLAECARVLAPGGWLVLTDMFSPLMAPTLIGGRRHKARTRRRAGRLLASAGFGQVTWHSLYQVIISTAAAAR